LRELAEHDKLGSSDRGWIKQEMNSIERGQRKTICNPPGKDLAHERVREAAKGYDYSHSNLQDRDLHQLQHSYDDFGRANTERPPESEHNRMEVNPKQMEAVLALPGPKRFQHFIKVVADWQEVWGLYRDGWALAAARRWRRTFRHTACCDAAYEVVSAHNTGRSR
jgi:hypothetical protein